MKNDTFLKNEHFSINVSAHEKRYEPIKFVTLVDFSNVCYFTFAHF